MKNQMKTIEKLGLGKLKIEFKPIIINAFGEKSYPKKTTIVVTCSRNNARQVAGFIWGENGGEISKMFWNGKKIEYNNLKITHRAIAA